MLNLALALADWTDIDIAAHALARVLGLMPAESTLSDAKWVYWSNNPLGNELIVLLDRLVSLGFLEKRAEPDLQYRIHREFRATFDIENIWQRARKPVDQASPPKLGLVVLRCSDIERSRHFYEALGVSFAAEQHAAGPLHYSTTLGGTVLELYPARTTPVTHTRLAFSVADLVAVLDLLRDSPNTIVRAEPNATPPFALLRDPDGNHVELSMLP